MDFFKAYALVFFFSMTFPIISESAIPKSRSLTKAEKHAVEKVIKDNLKDPFSVKFQHEKYIISDELTYCAHFNAKNEYGAYTGFKPFIVLMFYRNKDKINKLQGVTLVSFADSKKLEFAITEICKRDGYFLKN